MRLVVDTNVLVSALLKPGSVPALALEAVIATGSLVMYDARVLAEYRDVLARPKFRLDAAQVDALLARLLQAGPLAAVEAWDGTLRDDGDRCFVEVARAAHADAVVTGNVRDFPLDLGFAVWPPATLLAQLTLVARPARTE